jgi:SAM-dependent methyltransferase
MRADIERWNRKYSTNEDTVEPLAEPELKAYEATLGNNGFALELACGKGANALYLASLGFTVVAADASITGLRICQRSAAQSTLKIFPVVMDIDQCALPEDRFALISVVRYLNRAIFPALITALKPGGVLFYKTFNQRHLEQHPKFNADYVLQQDELQHVFSELELIGQSQAGSNSFILARKRTV